MKISIVTPSYNQGHFLEQTLCSVLDQQEVDLEYVVVDGGSQDASAEIIAKYADRLVWWCSEPDGGQYEAINKGFSHTTGDVMAWINSSDAYLPWTLNTVQRIFEAFPEVDWITSLYKTCIAEDGSFRSIQGVPGFSQRAFRAGLHGSSTNTNFIQQETCFWRRSLWEKIGGAIKPAYRFAADFHLWAEFFQHAKLVGVAAPLAVFRFHGEQRSAVDRYVSEADQILASEAPQIKGACPVWNLYPAMAGSSSEGRVSNGWRLEVIPDDGILFEMADLENALHRKEMVIRELSDACDNRMRVIEKLQGQADLKYQLKLTLRNYRRRILGI